MAITALTHFIGIDFASGTPEVYKSSILEMLREQDRWPHYVHYRGKGAPVHCAPDRFFFVSDSGPSDCDWIVPGTTP